MKRLTLLTLMLTCILISCDKKHTIQPMKRVKTLAAYFAEDSTRKIDAVIRIEVDTAIVSRDANGKAEAKFSREKYYLIPQTMITKDSLGRPVRDSAGKIQTYLGWVLVEPWRIIQDFDVNVDSLMQPEMWAKRDSIQKAADDSIAALNKLKASVKDTTKPKGQ